MQLTMTPYRYFSTAVAAGKSHLSFYKVMLLSIMAYIVLSKDVSVQFGLNSIGASTPKVSAHSAPHPEEASAARPTALPAPSEPASKKKVWKDKKANTFANLTFILSPDYAERKGIDPDLVAEKKQKCSDYVALYAPVAQKEMAQYGIPASITLAQALLESNVGDSRLAVESNNHFGIKCRSKCKGCTCRNYTDDDVYDMFRVFDSVWESFREHSILLDGARYKKLQALDHTDYKGWARGLKKAGYATDKQYAEKLIKIIETLKLYRYDQQV